MENLLKGENLYLYKGTIYSGGGGGNNNREGNGGDYGGGGGGGGNNPWKRFRKKSQEILPTEKKGNSLGVPDVKGSINGGNKRTP